VRIEADDQIWMENRRVDARAVRANIQRLLAADPEAPVTDQGREGREGGYVVDVADAAREAGAGAVNWASDRKDAMSMREQAQKKASGEEAGQIDLTPMLDVVFIMLIFFIVTSSFVKEPGVETVQAPGEHHRGL
jgi:biopolymer transport protein ExbD